MYNPNRKYDKAYNPDRKCGTAHTRGNESQSTELTYTHVRTRLKVRREQSLRVGPFADETVLLTENEGMTKKFRMNLTGCVRRES